jgi:alpha-beta hydrolase superfamily lysophospholipase
MAIDSTPAALTDDMIERLSIGDLHPGMPNPGDEVVHKEGILPAWDGLELYWQSWEPQEEPRGVVCLMHGFGEHSARYHHLATFLVRAGYAVIAIDARGHGRSGGRRAHVQSFEEFPRDLDRVVAEAEKRWPGQHLVVFAHSNGGLIALHHALMSPGRVKAYAITSPFLGFKVEVPFLKALAGNVMSSVWPTLALPTELDPAVLTKNEEIVRSYADDPLVLDIATARWFTETKEAQRQLLQNASQVRAPFLFLVAGADELADPAASEEVFHRLGAPEREFEIFPDLLHEVMNESQWEQLSRRVLAWFERFR